MTIGIGLLGLGTVGAGVAAILRHPQGRHPLVGDLEGNGARLEAACAEAAQGEVVEAVNYNSPGQLVIAGHAGAVARALRDAGLLGCIVGRALYDGRVDLAKAISDCT